MTSRPRDFMASEPVVYDLLVRLVAQWRAKVGDPGDPRQRALCQLLDKAVDDAGLDLPAPNSEPYATAVEDLRRVLIELPATDVWAEHQDEGRWIGADQPCRLHAAVVGPNDVSYTLCDRLAWIGDKLLNQQYELKNVWPEPGVWSSWFESSRSRH